MNFIQACELWLYRQGWTAWSWRLAIDAFQKQKFLCNFKQNGETNSTVGESLWKRSSLDEFRDTMSRWYENNFGSYPRRATYEHLWSDFVSCSFPAATCRKSPRNCWRKSTTDAWQWLLWQPLWHKTVLPGNLWWNNSPLVPFPDQKFHLFSF